MSDAWIVVLAVGAATVFLKAAGPVFLGRRALAPRLQPVVSLLAPVMLAALVTTQTFAKGEEVVLDARVAGVAAAGALLLVWRQAPVVVAMAVAALVTGVLRLL